MVPLFFGLYLVVGLVIYRDYGLSWDEQAQRKTGVISALYINAKLNHFFLSPEALEAKRQRIKSEDDIVWGKEPDKPTIKYSGETLLSYVDRDYGVFFELILTGLEAVLKLEDSRSVYLMRHLCTFLLFYMSVFFFYLLIKNRFKNPFIGLVGALFLIFSPRIFADSFYNSKDLPFLSMFIIATYSLIRFLNRPSIPNAVFHAVTNAASVNIRIAGIIIPAITALSIAIEVLNSSSIGPKLRKFLPGFVTYLCLLPCLTVLFWPFLWDNVFHNFAQAFSNMSQFRWKGEVLYLGKYFRATSLPWHYIPVWIMTTTPPFYLACFVAGLYCACRMLWRNRMKLYGDDRERQDLISSLLFFIPIISVIVLKPVLYDGWRHLYFVYPAFLSIALTGFISFYDFTKSALHGTRPPVLCWVLPGALIISITSTGYFLIREHPYQQVYFNVLAGTNVKGKFELDYWGLAYRQGLEYVLKHDSLGIVKVNTANFPGKLNAKILSTKDRERLRYVPIEEAQYFLSNLRGRANHPLGGEYHSIKVNGVSIMVVYKLQRAK